MFLSILLPDPILPDESFDLLWSVCTDGDGAVPQGDLSLSIEGATIFPLGSPVNDVARHLATARTGGSFLFNIERLRAAAASASGSAFSVREFYRLGSHHILNCKFTYHDGSGIAELTKNVRVNIVGAVAPGLEWVGPQTHVVEPSGNRLAEVPWKTDYSCDIHVTNREVAPLMTDLVLTEKDVRNGDTSHKSHTANIAPFDSQTVYFPIPAKQWRWLIEPVWLISGPLEDWFEYKVAASGLDGDWSPVHGESSTLTVHVAVSDEKRHWALAAYSAFAIASGLDGAEIGGADSNPWSALGVGIGALVSHAIAEGCGHAALDPPKPDKSFKEPAMFILPNVCSKLENLPKSAEALKTWLSAACEFAAHRNHMFAIEAKVLGAMEAKDQKAEAALVEAYRSELQSLGRLYRTMFLSVKQATEEIQKSALTPAAIQSVFAEAHAYADRGDWPEKWLERAKQGNVDLDLFAQAVKSVKHDDLDIARAMRRATVELGNALQATVADVVKRYSALRPEYFGIQEQKTPE